MQSDCTYEHQLNNKQMVTTKYSLPQFTLQRDPEMKWWGIKGEMLFAGKCNSNPSLCKLKINLWQHWIIHSWFWTCEAGIFAVVEKAVGKKRSKSAVMKSFYIYDCGVFLSFVSLTLQVIWDLQKPRKSRMRCHTERVASIVPLCSTDTFYSPLFWSSPLVKNQPCSVAVKREG